MNKLDMRDPLVSGAALVMGGLLAGIGIAKCTSGISNVSPGHLKISRIRNYLYRYLTDMFIIYYLFNHVLKIIISLAEKGG